MQDQEGEIKAEASVHLQMFAQQDKWENLLGFRDCFHSSAAIFQSMTCTARKVVSAEGNSSLRKTQMFKEV